MNPNFKLACPYASIRHKLITRPGACESMLPDESQASFPGGNSKVAPPDPISNSEVKRFSADGSVGSPHVRVGHCQDLIPKSPDC